jgi:ABC-type spermidine/putrescine transport system permease subunit II
MRSRGWFRNGALALGLAFLYVPILTMVFFSFNN